MLGKKWQFLGYLKEGTVVFLDDSHEMSDAIMSHTHQRVFLYSFYVSLMHQYMLVRAFRLTRYLNIGSKNYTNHKIYFFGDINADQLWFWKKKLGSMVTNTPSVGRYSRSQSWKSYFLLNLCVLKSSVYASSSF